jgi:hypothetical protein
MVCCSEGFFSVGLRRIFSWPKTYLQSRKGKEVGFQDKNPSVWCVCVSVLFQSVNFLIIFTTFNTSQSLHLSLVKLTITIWRRHKLVKQQGQDGCSSLGTDLYSNRPTCSIEIFLESKLPRQQKCFLTVAVSRLVSVSHTK